MELALNLGWMVLATLMCWLWVRSVPGRGAERRTQIVALALVILILFPVISVTDDIVTAQNPAETDCCQRKDHVSANSHLTWHPVVAMVLPTFAEPSFGPVGVATRGEFLTPAVKCPGWESIQSRPPPAV